MKLVSKGERWIPLSSLLSIRTMPWSRAEAGGSAISSMCARKASRPSKMQSPVPRSSGCSLIHLEFATLSFPESSLLQGCGAIPLVYVFWAAAMVFFASCHGSMSLSSNKNLQYACHKSRHDPQPDLRSRTTSPTMVRFFSASYGLSCTCSLKDDSFLLALEHTRFLKIMVADTKTTE